MTEFNRNPLVHAGVIDQPPQLLVKATPSLWQADLDTASRYGGDLTRAALGAMNLRGDKKHIVVDTKVHMLMPGQCPAIPGWHTDGAPRQIHRDDRWTQEFSPLGQGAPALIKQQEWDELGLAPRFHLLVTGSGCLTEFITRPVDLDVLDFPTHDLYKSVTQMIENGNFKVKRCQDERVAGWVPYNEQLDEGTRAFAPSCTAVEWDWWNLHQGVLASEREWRFLIRVTESEHHAPLPPSRLDEIIRTQQMVYTPLEFGW